MTFFVFKTASISQEQLGSKFLLTRSTDEATQTYGQLGKPGVLNTRDS